MTKWHTIGSTGTTFLIVPMGMIVDSDYSNSCFVPLDIVKISLDIHKNINEINKNDMEQWVLNFYKEKEDEKSSVNTIE